MAIRLLPLLFVVAVFQYTEAGSRTGNQVQTLHPFLYFADGDVEILRHRAKATHAHIAKKISQAANNIKSDPKHFLPPRDWNVFSSRWNERYGNDLSALAMYVVLNELDLEARALALEYMDALVSLPNWRVRSNLRDDVPVAHSLAGLATAYDFLYEYLSESQRTQFLSKIHDVTRELYEKSRHPSEWWGKSYIQNHCATNFAALLVGALVVSRHSYKEAEVWKQHAHQMLNRTLFLLNFVVDGSMEEGVAYGSYTSRSLAQYVFLAKRHLKIDLTRGPWLREHFWFIYHTVLPGFQQTIGIADSNLNWFYGPESQLVFLDSFVLRNGWGNWLARKIHENRLGKESGYIQSQHQYNSMLHMEFVFYNASIGERPPSNHMNPQLHVFSDWGLVIYTGGQPHGTATRHNGDGRTFLSLKCGRLHGRAINEIVHKKRFRWLKSWHSFNPGHEHPDQGSFVYAPNGVPFITDTLYGPKYTWLNNALVFSPSVTSRCFAPYSGQLGECYKWFNYKNDAVWKAEGEIVASSKENGFVFMSGEMSKWYNSSLGLLSVYRSLTLLKPGALLVVDHIELRKGSPVKYMSAFFHNTVSSFRADTYPSGHGGAQIMLNGSIHRVTWCSSFRSQQSTATIGKSNHGKKSSSFVNVTTPFPRGAHFGRVAYLLTETGEHIQDFKMKGARDKGVHVVVTVNGVEHHVTIVTRHHSPHARYKFLGFGGFAKIDTKDFVVRFGLGVVQQWNKTGFRERKGSRFFRIPRSAELELSGPLILLPLGILTALVFMYRQLTRRVHLRLLWKWALFSLITCLCIASVIVYQYDRDCGHVLCPSAGNRVPILREPIETTNRGVNTNRVTPVAQAHTEHPPFLFYTSVPIAGVELLDVLFKNTTDFFRYHLQAGYFDRSSHRRNAKRTEFFDPCRLYQVLPPKERETKITRFFRKLLQSPQQVIRNIYPKKLQNALPAIRLEDPGWALRLQWLRRTLGQRVRVVIVLRDPRGWIHAWLRVLKNEPRRLRAVKVSLDRLKQQCDRAESGDLASEFRSIQSVLLKTESGQDVEFHKIFAHIWATYIKAVTRITKKFPKRFVRFVRFEDLLQKPKKTAQRVYRFIGIPLAAAVEHRIQQIARTGQYSMKSSGELINSRITTAWKRGLTKKQVADIEKICGVGMAKFSYTSPAGYENKFKTD